MVWMRLNKDRIGPHCIMASIYFLMLPLTVATNAASSSFLKLLAMPIGIYFLITMFFYRKEIKINMVHILFALYTVSTSIQLFVSYTPVSLNFFTGYMLNAALFLCISLVEYNERELKFMENIQVALLVILIAIPLLSGLPDGQRVELIIFGQDSDPNYFVGFFIFPFAVTLDKIFRGTYRLFYIALLCVALYIICLTGSRGGTLAIMVTGFAFAVIYPKKWTSKVAVIGTLIVFAVIFWNVILPYLPENILARMSVEDVIESKGTHRVDIWMSMFREIKDSTWEVIFGRGLDAMHTIHLWGKTYQVGAHNHTVQLLYNQGIVGFVCFSAMMIACIARCINKRKCVAVALIGMIGLSFSLAFNTNTKSFWNLIPYAAFIFADKKHGDESSDGYNPDESEIDDDLADEPDSDETDTKELATEKIEELETENTDIKSFIETREVDV